MALSIQGTPAAAAATTITLPTHAAGDLIVIAAYKDGATTIPTVPAAGGTVPTWNTIDGPTGSNTNALVVCWAKATANNHTSGTWTGATGLAVIVYRGQNPSSPIGGHSQGGGSGANTCLAPSITLTKTDGTSAIVHVGGVRNVTAWGAMGAGYTNRANVATEVRLATKDTTTTDGSQTLVPTNVSSGSGYRAQTLEVLVAVDITKTAGVTTSAETAQALSKTQAAQSKTLTIPTGANAAVALVKTQQAQSKTLGPAAGTNTALPITFQMVANDQHVSVTAAAETGSARPVGFTKAAQTKTVGFTAETGSAQTLAFSKASQSKSLSVSAETGAARPVSVSQAAQTKNLGVASETDAARPAATTQAAQSKSLGATATTDAPVSLTLTNQPISRMLGPATESSSARVLSLPGPIHAAVTPVTETGQARPLSFTQTPTQVTVGNAGETSTAVHVTIQGTSTYTIGAADETSVAVRMVLSSGEFGEPVAGTVGTPASPRGHIEHSVTGRLVNR